MSRLTHSHILTWTTSSTTSPNCECNSNVSDSVSEIDPLKILKAFKPHNGNKLSKHTTIILGATLNEHLHHIRIKSGTEFLPIFNGKTEVILAEPGIYTWQHQNQELIVILDQDENIVKDFIRDMGNVDVIAPENTSIIKSSARWHFYPSKPLISVDSLSRTLDALHLDTQPEAHVLRVWSDLDETYAKESFDLAFGNNLFNADVIKTRLRQRLICNLEFRTNFFSSLNAVGELPLPCYTPK